MVYKHVLYFKCISINKNIHKLILYCSINSTNFDKKQKFSMVAYN